MLAIVALRLLLAADPGHNNVYLKVFAPAALDFAAGRDLYELSGGFRYPPLAAAVLLPFARCGPVLGSILWRLANVAVLLQGVRALRRIDFPTALSSREFGTFLLLLAVACQTSVNNGQANPLVLGGLLLATANFARGRLSASAAGTGAAASFKVYPLAYGCVLAVIRPRLWLGLAIASAAILLLPFALQSADYLVHQYEVLVAMMRSEDRTQDLADSYRDLRLLAAALGLPLPGAAFTVLQVATGIGIAALCWSMRRARRRPDRVLATAFSLTMCWFMLFGPATEKSTYMLIGPTTAWSLVLAYRERRRVALALWSAANLLILVEHSGVVVSRRLQAGHPLLRCLLPAATVLAVVALLGELAGEREARQG